MGIDFLFITESLSVICGVEFGQLHSDAVETTAKILKLYGIENVAKTAALVVLTSWRQ